MTLPSSPMKAGFSDPVFEGQAAFRALMDAMARPGLVVTAGSALSPPAGLMPAAAAAILAICDFETPLWLSPALQGLAAGPYLRFHAGAPLVADPARAAFAVLDGRHEALRLSDFAQGDASYPDRSTTVLVQVSSLTAGRQITVSGPGIAGIAQLRVESLPADFAAQWHANRTAFPLGVDLIFVSGDQLVALPRSARLLGEAA